jgi:hypothetical protein
LPLSRKNSITTLLQMEYTNAPKHSATPQACALPQRPKHA